MTAENVPGAMSAAPRESDLVAFLRENPDFFLRHPGLVERLRIPHGGGGAVSLVQYQVKVLRERTQRLSRNMQELLANARDNEKLSQRLHRVTLRLMECRALEQVFERLYGALYSDFKADAAVLRLFRMPRSAADRERVEFDPAGAELARLFDAAFAEGEPVCGRLLTEQREGLFGDAAASVRSGVVVPLTGTDPVGVMAIGSRDPRRFHPAMGTVFLRQLGDIITRVTAPFIE